MFFHLLFFIVCKFTDFLTWILLYETGLKMEFVKGNHPELCCFGNVCHVVFWWSFACIYTKFHSAFNKVWGYIIVICDNGDVWMVYLISVNELWESWVWWVVPVFYQDKPCGQLLTWWRLRSHSVRLWLLFKGYPFLFFHFYFALQNISS